jgi:hypothetical protein
MSKEIDCPRCHEPCGWCGDYRHMHGTLRLPGVGGRKNTHCAIPTMTPEGDACLLCGGAQRVMRTVSYERIAP